MAIGGGHPNFPASSPFMVGGGATNVGINVTTNIAQAKAAFVKLKSTVGDFANRATKNFRDLDFHFRRINNNVIALGFAFAGVSYQATKFFERGAKMELFQARMEGITDSIGDSRKEMADLIDLAEKVPFKLDALARGFIKLKATGIDPITDEHGNGPLKALVDAMAAFGADSEVLDRAIVALIQMAGKGVVSMEELRQQLGESIPTALRIAAREMDMTVGKFVKAVSKGQITWEEFAKVFFVGLEKNYAGAAERLLKTFTGAAAQLDTQMDLLAKTVFVDTATMRYFTAAIKIATERIKDLRNYLQTAAGQEWIDSLWEGFKQVAIYAAQAVTPIVNIVKIIGELGSIVSDILSSAPAEVVGGGIIGFLLFGRAGIIPGAFIGAFGNEIAGIFAIIADFVKEVRAIFDSFAGGSIITAAAGGGILGFYIAGPKGALVGAIGGALIESRSKIKDFFDGVLYAAIAFNKALHSVLSGEFVSDAVIKERAKKTFDLLNSKIDELTGKGRKTDRIEIELDTGDAEYNAERLSQFFQRIDDYAKQAGDAASQALNQISESTAEAADKINLDIGGFDRIFPSKEIAVQQLTDYQKVVEAKITEIQDHIQSIVEEKDQRVADGMFTADLDTKLSYWDDILKRTVEMRNSVIDNINDIGTMATGNVATNVSDLLTSIQNFAAGVDTSFESINAMKTKMTEWSEQIASYKTQLQEANLTEEQRAEILNALTMAQNELASAMDLVNEKAAKLNAPLEENARKLQKFANDINDINIKAQKLILGARFSEEAERMAAAQGQITSILGDIEAKILEIQEAADKGLITQASADAMIANLNKMAAAVEANKAQILDAASDISQAWTEAGRQIYDAIQNSLSDAIYGLVTGTKSLKDVLLDFWNSITRAASDYLAKLIMMSLFGGQGGFMGMFSSIGMATGGSMTVDGRTGFDNNMLNMRVSRGERVTVETPAQQRSNSLGSGLTINISALDGASVRELFMREGSALHQALNHRLRLNHA